MTIEPKDLISKNHNRLLRFSTFANILAVLALVFLLIYGISMVLQFLSIQNTFQETGDPNPYNMFRQLTNTLSSIVHWLIYAVVLRAVSLALTQIVETDINYRMKAQEEDHE